MTAKLDAALTSSNIFAKRKRPVSEKMAAHLKKLHANRSPESLRAMQEKSQVVRKEKYRLKKLREESVKKEVEQIQLRQATEVARKMVLPAVGQTFIYKIITHKDAKGNEQRREHVLLESPHEIARALDAIANENGKDEDDDNLFYYASVKEPDYRAGETILNRALGKVVEKSETTIKTFSLIALAKERGSLPSHDLRDATAQVLDSSVALLPDSSESKQE